jgi:hypothetical protein
LLFEFHRQGRLLSPARCTCGRPPSSTTEYEVDSPGDTFTRRARFAAALRDHDNRRDLVGHDQRRERVRNERETAGLYYHLAAQPAHMSAGQGAERLVFACRGHRHEIMSAAAPAINGVSKLSGTWVTSLTSLSFRQRRNYRTRSWAKIIAQGRHRTPCVATPRWL